MAPPSQSELERRFLALVRRYGLAKPHADRVICGYQCDVVWPEHRVIVELDGRAHHDARTAFERDRARDRALAVAAWVVVRVTWRQLHCEPEALVVDLRALLAHRR